MVEIIPQSGDYVVSGVTSSGIALDSASMIILNGGVAVDTTVNRTGGVFISSGGSAIDTFMSGGSMFVSAGGFAAGTVLSGGSAIDSSGETPHVITFFSASMTIFDGGSATDTTVITGSLAISGGGSATGTVLSGGFATVFDGGSATGVVMSGGRQEVFSGGILNGAEVYAGGRLVVSSGGTAVEITENGGYVDAADGATVSFVPNTFGGLRLTDMATVHSATAASGVSVAGGGCLFLSGGSATDATVSGGGIVMVSDGGAVDGMDVRANGTLLVSSGCTLAGKLTFDGGAVVSAAPGAVLNFDLTREDATSAALVNGLDAVMGAPLYLLTVDADRMDAGEYFLADGAAGFEGMLNVKDADGAELGVLSAGDMIRLNETYYLLNLDPDGAALSLKATGLENGPDDGWNDYVYDKKRGYNAENIDRFNNTVLSDGVSNVQLDEKGSVYVDGMRNYVGPADAADYAKITLDCAADLSFDISAAAAGAKFTVWSLVVGEDKRGNPTYKMKSLQSTSLKKDKKTGLYAATSKKLLLEAGTHFVSVQFTKKTGEAYCSVSLSGESGFYSDGDDGWNNYVYDKKRGYNAENVDKFVSTEIGAGTTHIMLDSDAPVSDEWDNFTGFGDAADYAKIAVSAGATLSFTLGATDAAKFTVWRLVVGEDKRGNPAYKMKSLQSTSLKKEKKTGLYAAVTKAYTFAEAGVYFISMESTNAKKGSYTYYNVSLNSALVSGLEAASLAMPALSGGLDSDVCSFADASAALASGLDELAAPGETSVWRDLVLA